MLARVRAQVDALGGRGDPTECGFADGTRRPRDRDDRAVVVRIHLAVEHEHAGDAAHRLDDLVEHLGPPALTEIRNAFDDLGHHFSSFV